jgi:tRNA/tmRNA/rRNA uracil-C5-methylase (TrmA/RlmC/RlmD family)
MRIVDLKIEDVAFGGKGVARENGKAIFIPFTVDEETVSAEIVREKKQFAEAELVAVREASPHRVTPECPYFGRCGGCSYQHIDYEHQLAIKWRQVRDVLQRIGKLRDIPIRPIIPSPLAYAYRNRITVHAQDGTIGFFRRDSHRLIDVERCPISMDEVNLALRELRASHPRDGHYTLRAEAGPRVFSQTNDAVAKVLLDLIAQYIPDGQQSLVDAYCGAGFFSKALLDKFEQVIGIDWDKFAIQAAQETATEKETYIAGDIEKELVAVAAPLCRGETPGRLGSIHLRQKPSSVEATSSNRAHYRITSGSVIAPTSERTSVIVDPPATGLTAGIRRTIIDLAPTTFIYVSCNPPTLARDLAELTQKFAVESITPLDMFPQTAEIEVVAHLHL